MTERDEIRVLTPAAPSSAALHADGPARCSGALAELAVADVLQLLQLIGKSAVMTVTVEHGGAQSRLWCSEGSLIDAESGRLRGEAAAYRVLALDDGWLEAELRHELRPKTIEAPTQRLLLEAARRKDETLALQRKLGEERCCYRLVHEPEPAQLASPSAAELRLLRVLAGAPSVGELLAESDLGDLETLVLLDRWFDAGYLAKVGVRPEAPASHSAIDAALFDPPQQVPSLAPLAASVPPRRAPRSLHFAPAVAGAALLAVASFAGGYLLRDSSGTSLVGTAATSPTAGEPLEAPQSESELHWAAGKSAAGKNAAGKSAARDDTAPTDPSSEDTTGVTVAAPSPSESAARDSVAEGSSARLEPGADRQTEAALGASAPAAAGGTARISGQQLAVSSGNAGPEDLPHPGASDPPPPARAQRKSAAPTPAITEPRVRVIGATEPSVRLLD
ncbi:MAG: hypothetical protein RL685_4320 [Pseudomonadota bacterium]